MLYPIFFLVPLKPCWAAVAKKVKQVVPKASAPREDPQNSEAEDTREEVRAKRWGARILPIAMLMGRYTADAGIHFNDHWALGPTFRGYAGSRRSFRLGVRGTAKGFFTAYYLEALPALGWYLTLRIQKQKYISYPASDASSQVIKHITGNTADLLAGYRKQMANSFFILLGAGLERKKYKIVKEQLANLNTESRNDRVVPCFEAKLGLDF